MVRWFGFWVLSQDGCGLVVELLSVRLFVVGPVRFEVPWVRFGWLCPFWLFLVKLSSPGVS